MKTINKYKTFLPMFEGFNDDSNLNFNYVFDSEIYNINANRKENNLNEININDFEINYTKYKSHIVKKLCKTVENEILNRLSLKLNILFEDLILIENDVIETVKITIEIDNENLNQLTKLINENKSYIAYRIESDFENTNHSNNINDWLNIEHKDYYLTNEENLNTILELLFTDEIYYSDVSNKMLENFDLNITDYLKFDYEELRTYVMIDKVFQFNSYRLQFDENGTQFYS